ncbi:hypothetical protein ASE95_15020 [Sphingomonas sp. Leaf231]|uniref:flagellar basal body P-ring formation chaperone FlgA n=1 Tax=Sphingomonas sp. Leaf231 TaxID=1736301 RepID=UPI0007006F72|nr:flagellar basal body P-ring formation chaperone FlgA [Sphingomonas sp. Leaf231]KQN90026.1 hypothetical protein ASE95_15020 [Sphingomonas sp. Leaf231]
MMLAANAAAALLAGVIPAGNAARPVAATPAVFVLAHPVAAGTTLSVGDFRLREATDPPSVAGSVLPADAAGQQATHHLPTGRVVRTSDIRSPQLIRRGDAVSITYRAGGLSITTPGQATSGAAHGQPIRVLALATRRTVDAVVDGPRRVRIINEQE